ncbi:uncharacterized protein [Pyrus communis]|uniref:uncharacterized protein n=1 Tax=Pyrus communis TaxID=23211 RepID=UPI0035BEF986
MEGGAILRKFWCLVVALFVISGKNWGLIEGVDGAAGGECGEMDPDVLVYKLASCAASAQDKNVAVPNKCCAVVSKVRANCLCSILLSKEAKSLGIRPDVAATIPKRCKVARRTRGYKCGAFVVPA